MSTVNKNWFTLPFVYKSKFSVQYLFTMFNYFLKSEGSIFHSCNFFLRAHYMVFLSLNKNKLCTKETTKILQYWISQSWKCIVQTTILCSSYCKPTGRAVLLMVREISSVTTKESFPLTFHKRNHIFPDVYVLTILILMMVGNILIWIIQFRAFSFIWR